MFFEGDIPQGLIWVFFLIEDFFRILSYAHIWHFLYHDHRQMRPSFFLRIVLSRLVFHRSLIYGMRCRRSWLVVCLLIVVDGLCFNFYEKGEDEDEDEDGVAFYIILSFII